MLNKNIRCDRCHVEAWVTVENPLSKAGELDFCSHDYNEFADALQAQGFIVTVDEREHLNAKPSVSASV